MSLSIGVYDAEIVSTGLGSTNKDSAYVSVLCRIEDDQISAKIWLTEKSMGMAKKALKLCGFDIEKQELSALRDDPFVLAGKSIKVEITEDPKYGMQANVLLSDLSDAKIKKLTQSLRKSKADGGEAGSSGDGDNIPF